MWYGMISSEWWEQLISLTASINCYCLSATSRNIFSGVLVSAILHHYWHSHFRLRLVLLYRRIHITKREVIFSLSSSNAVDLKLIKDAVSAPTCIYHHSISCCSSRRMLRLFLYYRSPALVVAVGALVIASLIAPCTTTAPEVCWILYPNHDFSNKCP